MNFLRRDQHDIKLSWASMFALQQPLIFTILKYTLPRWRSRQDFLLLLSSTTIFPNAVYAQIKTEHGKNR
jgi:hypothetical protein